MSARVTVKDRGAKALLARARALRDGPRVRVGILDDSPKRDREGGTGSKLSLAEVAALHEYGAPGANIPQRSFLRATVDERRADVEKLLGTLGGQVLTGEMEPRQALDLLGSKVAAMCQNRIAEGIAPPLKPSTIARKGSSKPLIDTGQLRSSITWKVEG